MLTHSQGLFCPSDCPAREQAGGVHAAGTADPSDIPYHMMSYSAIKHMRLMRGQLLGDWLGIG